MSALHALPLNLTGDDLLELAQSAAEKTGCRAFAVIKHGNVLVISNDPDDTTGGERGVFVEPSAGKKRPQGTRRVM